jgi:Zn-dependent protease
MDGSSRTMPEPTRWRRAAGPLAVAAVFALGKLKWVFGLLKVAKLGTLVSMLLTVGVYASFWGLPFAAGFVLLIFVHEMGHAIAMRREGIAAGAPVFIPFVGAVIAMKHLPRNAWVEAVVGIGGPLLGTAGAAGCLVVAFATDSLFWFALASTGFLLNLFNMIPLSPLDGGRIVGVVSRALWAVGFAVGGAVWWMTESPLLLIILLIGAFQLYRQLKNPRPDYYDIAGYRRAIMGAAYFGLLAFMVLGMWVADAALAMFGAGEALTLSGPALVYGLLDMARDRAAGRALTGASRSSGANPRQ